MVNADNPDERRRFQFNPSPVDISNKIEYEQMDAPGLGHPFYQYTKGNSDIYSFTIQLDDKGRESGYTADFIDFINQFKPKEGQFDPPSPVIIAYGSAFIIEGVITEVKTTINRFDPDSLFPTQADIDITIQTINGRGR